MLRRHPRVLAGLVIVGWLLVVGIASPFAAKLSSVANNDSSVFLPSTAEATQVLDAQPRFEGRATTPAIIVFQRSSGITSADRRLVESQVAHLTNLPDIVGTPSPVIPSKDGKALEVVVSVNAATANATTDGVDALRHTLRGAPGLVVYVTGPAGLSADFGAAFAALDVKLLIGTSIVVIAILLFVYRSPVLWIVPLASVALALFLAMALVYVAATRFSLQSNGMSQGLLTVLTFGAGTDYALLLISRYREELQRFRRPAEAMTVALRGAGPAILASGTTVILALLCLLFSENGANRSLGPTAALGIACAMISMLTLLPAILVLAGRGLFWPARPQATDAGRVEKRPGVWERLSEFLAKRSHVAWISSAIVLCALAIGVTGLAPSGIAPSDQYTVSVDSVVGQRILDQHFPSGTADSAAILARAGHVAAVEDAARGVPGVSGVTVVSQGAGPNAEPKVVDGQVLLNVALVSAPDSTAATATVERLRTVVHAVPGAHALVGGTTAIEIDTASSAARDRNLIIPIVLVLVLVILIAVFRSLLLPVLVIGSVVLSYLAALGASVLVFTHAFHFSAEDSSYPLDAFVFLVALGIDYNIFLLTRVREEAKRMPTRPAILRGLASTGSVITSAGIVLAATFAVFGVLPLVIFAELGFTVAFGVLLDTVVVRSILLPMLAYDVGHRLWWPRRTEKDLELAAGADADAVSGPPLGG